jgi:citrate lyase beta subunit
MLLSESERTAFLATVNATHQAFVERFPGTTARQPTHVLYGGLHLFSEDTISKLARVAGSMWETYVPDPASLTAIFGTAAALAPRLYARVARKLSEEAIEDYRIDSEDGYGHRADVEEDEHASTAGAAFARLMREGRPPPFLGLRIKPLSPDLAPRAVRTLERFVAAAGSAIPHGFIVTLPKITSADQLSAAAHLVELIEARASLPTGTFRLEAMMESAPGLLEASGACVLPSFVAAAKGRLFSVHLGAYDYTASLEIAAPVQTLSHPACEQLRQVMKLSFAGTSVFVADGATTQLPLAVHKGANLGADQVAQNTASVVEAFRAHARNVDHALESGIYQGWDLHPGQLIPRYVATFGFFLAHQAAMTRRLSNFVERLGQATSLGTSFDDAATGQGLLNFFLRGWACGAFTDDDVRASGLSLEEVKRRDFGLIASARR